jgi:hypothetical protein
VSVEFTCLSCQTQPCLIEPGETKIMIKEMIEVEEKEETIDTEIIVEIIEETNLDIKTEEMIV